MSARHEGHQGSNAQFHLSRRIQEMVDSKPDTRVVYGVAASSTTVRLSGPTSTAVTVPSLVGMVNGDYVAVLENGADLLVLGVVGRGSINVQYATPTADVTVTSSSSASPSYIAGTYILVSSAAYDRKILVDGASTISWTAGGDVTARVVYSVVGLQLNGSGGFTIESPYAVNRAPGHAVAPGLTVPVMRQPYSLAAGDYLEARMYGWRNGSSTNVAIAYHTYLRTTEIPA